jgi:hypothetical protein
MRSNPSSRPLPRSPPAALQKTGRQTFMEMYCNVAVGRGEVTGGANPRSTRATSAAGSWPGRGRIRSSRWAAAGLSIAAPERKKNSPWAC